jgi:hypothetical protein
MAEQMDRYLARWQTGLRGLITVTPKRRDTGGWESISLSHVRGYISATCFR